MRGSAWSYFVPYEADISLALQQLREDVFARGEYKSFADMVVAADLAVSPRETVARAGNFHSGPAFQRPCLDLPRLFREWHQPLKPVVPTGPRPGSIRELLDRQAGAGTHSILDITSMSPRPKPGAISPFPASRLVELFGADTPDHFSIQAAYAAGTLAAPVSRRAQGIYIITYRNHLPDEIFFAGRSGG